MKDDLALMILIGHLQLDGFTILYGSCGKLGRYVVEIKRIISIVIFVMHGGLTSFLEHMRPYRT